MPGAKRVGQCTPGINTEGHFRLGKQAGIQFGGQSNKVDVLADKHQLLAAVAGLGLPVFHNRLQALLILWPLRLGHKAPPAPGKTMAHQTARLGPAAGFLILAGQPEEALAAQQTAISPFTVDEVEEPLGMEGPARPVSGGGNAVFLGFRDVFTAQLLEPTRRLSSALEVETTCVE